MRPRWRTQDGEFKETHAGRPRFRENFASAPAKVPFLSSKSVGFPQQTDGDARPPLERTASLALAGRRKGRSNETRLARISTHIFNPAERARHRCEGTAGTAPSCR